MNLSQENRETAKQIIIEALYLATLTFSVLVLGDSLIERLNPTHHAVFNIPAALDFLLLCLAIRNDRKFTLAFFLSSYMLFLAHGSGDLSFGITDLYVLSVFSIRILNVRTTVPRLKFSRRALAVTFMLIAGVCVLSNINGAHSLLSIWLPGSQSPRYIAFFIILSLLAVFSSARQNTFSAISKSDLPIVIGVVLVFLYISTFNSNVRTLANDVAQSVSDELAEVSVQHQKDVAGLAMLQVLSEKNNILDANSRLLALTKGMPNVRALFLISNNNELLAGGELGKAATASSDSFIMLPKAWLAPLKQSLKPATSEIFVLEQKPYAAAGIFMANTRNYLVVIYPLSYWFDEIIKRNSKILDVDIVLAGSGAYQSSENALATHMVDYSSGSSVKIIVRQRDHTVNQLAIVLLLFVIAMSCTIKWCISLVVRTRQQAGVLTKQQGDIIEALQESDQLRQSANNSELLFRSLFEENPDMIFLSDTYSNIIDANPSAIAKFKYSHTQLMEKTIDELLLNRAAINSANNNPSSAHDGSFEVLCFDSSQGKLFLSVNNFPVHSDTGPSRVFTVARDLSGFRLAQQDILLRQRALDACSNGIVISDARQPHQPIVYVNAAFERITGYSANEVIGRNCRFLSTNLTLSPERDQLRKAIHNGESIMVVIQNRRKNGELFWNDLKIEPVFDEDQNLSHFVGVQTDVTVQKNHEQELSFHATHDLLTGLPNRALLEDRLKLSVANAQRHQRPMAVMFIDLDEFKPINDSFGHAVGDEVLMEVAERLRCQTRNVDTLARLGGDEYILLLPELQKEDDVYLVAERILACIDSPFLINGLELHLTCSIGISLYHSAIIDPKTLLQQADMAMYRAKQNGRNNYNLFTSDLDAAATITMQNRNDLRHAIRDDQLELLYQPQIDGRTGRVSGIEALVRWNHPTRGVISPTEFIPLAEANGQILPIGRWVLETACQFALDLSGQQLCDCPMSVNVSPLQIQRQAFDQVVSEVLSRIGLAPELLDLEITESVLMQDMERALSQLQAIHASGVRLTIDDFGTGYSSLNYLKILPLNNVKIDRSFITEITHNPSDAAIVNAIVAMSRQLSMTVIAEGVENVGQYSLLLKNKCAHFQGYLFSRPLKKQALIEFLRSNKAGVPLPEISEQTQRTLLLVDDEQNILRALSRTLRKEGYNIFSCTSAQEAFEVLALNSVQVIVSDQRMPGMTGTEFLNKVKDIYPHTIRMVLSGFTDLNSVTEAINQGSIYKYLTKPWDDVTLCQAISQAFSQYEDQINTLVRLDLDRR